MRKSIIIMTFASLFLNACQAVSAPQAPIKKFYFHHDGTLAGMCNWTVSREKDGTVRFTLDDHMRRDYSNISDTVPAAFMDSLEALCLKHKVHQWDGYDKYDRHICDGSGFSLNISYEDGRSVNAHGMNKFPSGYREFRDELTALCEPVCAHLMEVGRLQRIAEGVQGELRSILFVFASSAPGPIYTYHAHILRDDLRDNNVDIEIKHSDGSVFPAGDYRFYCRVPDQQIQWEQFAELIRKYNVIQWYDWDQHDEQNKEAEWFQIGFSFDKGHINAHGSAHPENYDAFREDFLKLFMKTFAFLFDNKD